MPFLNLLSVFLFGIALYVVAAILKQSLVLSVIGSR